MPSAPTIRSLAADLKLSVATVSEALRDSKRVHPETRERVKAHAKKLGYQANPLLGATFSALRMARHHGFSGMLALVDVAAGPKPELMLFHREVVRGATARAKELGFGAEVFWVGKSAPALSVKRLKQVLRARGIYGVIFLPFDRLQDFSEFDFQQISAVGMDHRLVKPSLHTVQPDHYLSMRRALERLAGRGYARMGLCIEARKDERVDHKWSSGFLSFFRLAGRELAVPPLIAETLSREAFRRWFRAHKPDVIIGHGQIMVEWLREMRVKVPDDVGFFRINVTERSQPCAGLDLQPHLLGAVAVETVVAMLHRREQGVPRFPNTISIDAVWSDGPSLREEHSKP